MNGELGTEGVMSPAAHGAAAERVATRETVTVPAILRPAFLESATPGERSGSWSVFRLTAVERETQQDWETALRLLPWHRFGWLALELARTDGRLSVAIRLLPADGTMEEPQEAVAAVRRIMRSHLGGFRASAGGAEDPSEPRSLAEVVPSEPFERTPVPAPLTRSDQLRPLLQALLDAPSGAATRVLVRRTCLTPEELRYLEDVARSPGAGGRAAALLEAPYLFEVRVLVASEDALDHGLLTAVEACFTSPSTGAARILRPLTAEDLAVARAAWHGGAEARWAPSVAPPGLERLRYLHTAAEASGLLRLPGASDCPLPGLPLALARTIPPVRAASEEGVLIGWSADRRPVRLAPEDRLRHLYVVGQTGTGKSTLLESLAREDMEAGRGVAVIDPHGDLAERLIGAVPEGRIEEVVYFDAGDTDFPIGLNILEAQAPEERQYVLQDLPEIFYRLFDPGRTGIIGPFFEHLLRGAVLTLTADPGSPGHVFDIPRLFLDPEFREARTQGLSDPLAREYWHEYELTTDFHRSEYLGWFIAKFDRFRTNPVLRNICGQGRTPFSLREVMDRGGIFIANLSVGRIGLVNASMLGMFLVLKLQAAALGRASEPASARRPFHVYADEFQLITSASFSDLLAGGRKYGIAVTVANQYVAQLPAETRDAALSTVGSLVAFRVGAEDAGLLAPRLLPLEAVDLMYLSNFTAAATPLAGGEPVPAFTLRTPPPGPFRAETAEAVRERSRRRLARPRADVERELGSA
jgi:hypothetical protein